MTIQHLRAAVERNGRNLRLAASAFATVGVSGEAAFLLTQNSLWSVLFALSIAAGLSCYFGRKWYREIIRSLEASCRSIEVSLEATREHQTAVTALSGFWVCKPGVLVLLGYCSGKHLFDPPPNAAPEYATSFGARFRDLHPVSRKADETTLP
jgi:hypothetical protein